MLESGRLGRPGSAGGAQGGSGGRRRNYKHHIYAHREDSISLPLRSGFELLLQRGD